MKISPSLCLLTLSILFISGCVSDGSMFSGGSSASLTGGGISGSSGSEISAPKIQYNGPKIRLAVMSFDNKTGQTTTISQRGGSTVIESDPIGQGMSDQLTTALMQTGAFIAIERQFIADIQNEKALTGDDQDIQLAKPDYFIYGAVTEYQFSQSDTSLGVGFSATSGSIAQAGIALLAQQAFSAMTKKDHIAIDLRVVDANTGEVIAATSVEGSARDFGASLGGIFGNTLIGASGSYRTPPAKAVRACCIKSANWLGEQMIARQELERSALVALP